jgi:glutaredoxin/glutathione-dependent peroxiredoxin
MSINIGDKIPAVTLKRLGDGGMQDVDTGTYFQGKKVVLFSVPGAFTPTCSNSHLPGYVEHADEIRAQGVDEIICLAVNDPFVMKAWGEQKGADGKVTMLPDGNGELTRALGLDVDISKAGLGTRGKRFSMTIVDGVVKSLEVEDNPGVVEVSGAAACLARL